MELNKLRHERTKIVTEGNLQSENIDSFYSPVRISFNDAKKNWNRIYLWVGKILYL